MLRALLIAAVATTAVHYTHNVVAFERYPSADWASFITAPVVAIAWFVFTAFGVLGYVRYRQGRMRAASAYLATFSVSGFFTLGHWLPGQEGGDISPLMTASILLDGVMGVAVLAYAVRLARQATPQRA